VPQSVLSQQREAAGGEKKAGEGKRCSFLSLLCCPFLLSLSLSLAGSLFNLFLTKKASVLHVACSIKRLGSFNNTDPMLFFSSNCIGAVQKS